MTELLQQLQADLKDAMRAKDSGKTGTLRMVLSDLKNAGIDKKGSQGLTEEVANPAEYLSAEEALKVVQSAVKKRRESIELYQQGGRDDLSAKEQAEIEVLQTYLPAELGAEELEAIVATTIAEIGADSMAQMGAVMKAVMPKLGGRADGKAVSAVVKKLLG